MVENKMQENSVSRLLAKINKVVLDKDNIDSMFVKLMNRRDIRGSVVNKLVTLLEKGEHFETPLMTNRVNGTDRLLDGNHRVEAISKYLLKHPNRKVEVNIFYYENLDEEAEREIYTKWNLGTKQNINDFVKQYWDTIYIVRLIETPTLNFPCKISHVWRNNTIEFKTLIGAYLTKENRVFTGNFSGNATEFIKKSQALNEKDYALLKVFMNEYIDVFGRPDKKNMHYKSAVFNSIMRIWLDNRMNVTMPQMKNGLIKLRGHERVVYYSSLGGTRDNTKQCKTDLVNVLNGNRKTILFI